MLDMLNSVIMNMRYPMFRSLVLLVLLSVVCSASDLLPVWTMDHGFDNALGGGYNHFAATPSSASVHFPPDIYRGEDGRCLKIDYNRNHSGYCGVWTHLFDERVSGTKPKLLDASGFEVLSFWVRGARGGEDFTIQLADETWLKKEDSSPVGKVSDYLPDGITTQWQEVVVPLKDVWVDTAKLGGLTFNFTEPGEGTIYIDDIYFKKDAGQAVPESKKEPFVPHTERHLVRAMWVWETKELLTNETMRDAFFGFCREQRVNEIFLQLIYRFSKDGERNETCELLRPGLLRALIAECSANGIKVHALDGYPEFALTSQHPKVLAQVRAIIQYNGEVNPEERFYGIHLDNEPYQILGFDGPQRDSILLQFFALNREVMNLLKEENSELVYGIDIPNWFDEMSPPCALSFEGKTQDPARHLIDICDNVGIMDYRTFAYGVDGIIHHGLGEMKYADQAGKKIYIGVETFRYKPTPVSFIYGMPEDKWKKLTSNNAYLLSSRVNDFRVRTLSDGSMRYFGIAHPIPLKNKRALDLALMELYRRFSAKNEDVSTLKEAAEMMISSNPEYKGFEPFVVRDKNGKLQSAGFTTTEYMLDKITFAGKSKKEMESVLAEVADYFYEFPSFYGFAVHYYSTWKAMK